jgi:hypothetical protein
MRGSLTELEATGIVASSAQSLGTGKSAELAREEIARAASLGVKIVSLDDPGYPQLHRPELLSSELVIPRPTARAWQSVWRVIWRLMV